MKNFYKKITVIIVVFIMVCLIIYPERYVSSAKKGIELWAINVLPALFPFFFLTLLLTKIGDLTPIIKPMQPLTERVFRCNGISFYVFVMSVISGYPVGARLISELYKEGKISKAEATRTATFCSTSGPVFVIGTVGTVMFENKTAGVIAFVSHILSAVICGIIFSRNGDFEKRTFNLSANKKTDNVLYECVYSSVLSILAVGGFICLFYILAQILSDFKLLYLPEVLLSKCFFKASDAPTLSHGLVCGFIESTLGCKILSSYPSCLSVSLACAVISFGGLSIIFQSLIFLSQAKINVKLFLLSKILQTFISFAICFLLLTLFNVF